MDILLDVKKYLTNGYAKLRPHTPNQLIYHSSLETDKAFPQVTNTANKVHWLPTRLRDYRQSDLITIDQTLQLLLTSPT